MQNYWNLDLKCKRRQLTGPFNYRDCRETGPCPFTAAFVVSFPAKDNNDNLGYLFRGVFYQILTLGHRILNKTIVISVLLSGFYTRSSTRGKSM